VRAVDDSRSRAQDHDSALPIVVGVPGRVDYRDGVLEHAPNLPNSWVSDLREDRLADALGQPVALANDGDLAAVGEACFGAGRGHVDVVYVTVSTGIGAGVVSGGRLLRGRRSIAEIGHTVLDRAVARAGDDATVEDLGSGTALGRLAEAACLEPDGAKLTAAVRSGDDRAQAVWDRAVEAAALGIANLTQLFAPDVVVVGGGMGRNGELMLGPVRAAIERHGPVGLAADIAVVAAVLGDDAGLVGAAGWHAAFDASPAT
jgi:glucokinase